MDQVSNRASAQEISSSKKNPLLRILNSVDIKENTVQIVCAIVFLYRNMITISLAILFALIMKPRQDSLPLNKNQAKGLIRCIIYLLIALEFETIAGFLVSYLDNRKYEYQPEQDFFYDIMFKLIPGWVDFFNSFSNYFTLPGADNYTTILLLLLILNIGGKVKLNKVNILIWGQIFFKALAITRIIRVLSFSSTLLPNPKPHCFEARFHMPADSWDFFKEMATPRFGGCNDLVISGHTLMICMGLYVILESWRGWSVYLIKFLTPITLLNIVMMRNHYTLDVFLGIVISKLCWELEKHKNVEFAKKTDIEEMRLITSGRNEVKQIEMAETRDEEAGIVIP